VVATGVDPDLAVRVGLAICAERCSFARSTSIRRSEAGVLDVGGGSAVYTGHGLFSNRAFALGLRSAVTEDELEMVERFYAERAAATEIELASIAAPQLVRLLSDRGYRLVRFRNIYATTTLSARPRATRAVIETVEESNRDDWSATLVAGFGYDDPPTIERVEEWNEALAATPGLTALLARVDGEPAGAASILVQGTSAVLGGAATRTGYRRGGIQSALIAERLELARAAGCDLAVVTADPGSTSARNAERAGFRLVCTHAVLRSAKP